MDTSPPSVPPHLPVDASPANSRKRLADRLVMRLLMPVGQSGWAIVAGYAGLFALNGSFAPVALVLGIIAAFHVWKSRGTAKPKYGMGRVAFALIMGAVGTAPMLTSCFKGLMK